MLDRGSANANEGDGSSRRAGTLEVEIVQELGEGGFTRCLDGAVLALHRASELLPQDRTPWALRLCAREVRRSEITRTS